MKSGESDVGILEKGVLSSGPSLLVGGGSVIWFGAVHVDLSFAPSVLGYHVRVVDSDHCEWSVEILLAPYLGMRILSPALYGFLIVRFLRS